MAARKIEKIAIHFTNFSNFSLKFYVSLARRLGPGTTNLVPREVFHSKMSVTASDDSKSIIIPGLYPNRKGPRKLGSFESFLISALAPAGLVFSLSL
jgi:hypothetical protein